MSETREMSPLVCIFLSTMVCSLRPASLGVAMFVWGGWDSDKRGSLLGCHVSAKQVKRACMHTYHLSTQEVLEGGGGREQIALEYLVGITNHRVKHKSP